MEKAQLMNHLRVIRGNFATGLILSGLLRTLDERQVRRNRIILRDGGLYIVQPNQELQLGPNEPFYEVKFGGPEQWDISHASLEFSKMLLRNLTNDSFELISDYCEESRQLDMLQAQCWFDFGRLVRNALTHNQRWMLSRPHDIRLLPVTWRGKTISASLHDTEVTFEFYDWYDGCELWNDICSFAETLK